MIATSPPAARKFATSSLSVRLHGGTGSDGVGATSLVGSVSGFFAEATDLPRFIGLGMVMMTGGNISRVFASAADNVFLEPGGGSCTVCVSDVEGEVSTVADGSGVADVTTVGSGEAMGDGSGTAVDVGACDDGVGLGSCTTGTGVAAGDGSAVELTAAATGASVTGTSVTGVAAGVATGVALGIAET
jgi:hypothetical protein